jgi:hypothetical protein
MNSSIPTITSNAGEALTVLFYSDVSVTGEGFSITVTYSGSCCASPTLGTLSNGSSRDFCNSSGNYGSGGANIAVPTVSGQSGTVVWDWGSNNGVWNNNWVTAASAGTCCFPKKIGTSNGDADRIRYRVTNSCGEVTSATILINNYHNDAPSSLASSDNNICSTDGGTLNLTATFPSSINMRGTVKFYSGSCGGTLLGSVSPSAGSTTAVLNIAKPTSTTTYYARYEPGVYTGCANTACAQVTVTVNPASGNPSVFGSNVWNVYCYNGNNFETYRGFYTENNLSFGTYNRWLQSGNPTTTNTASGSAYSGCSINNDNHSYIYKRQGFTPGLYSIDINRDDEYILLVDGTQVATGGCCGWAYGVWSGQLTASSTIEIRLREYTGDSYLGANINLQCTFPAAPGFGSNTWNVLGYRHSGYNFANLSSLTNHTYYGYYSNSTVDIVSTNQWCSDCSPSNTAGWSGCTLPSDYHTVVYKRQGFPTAAYQIDLNGHDDGVQCYVNGVLVYQIDGCCADRGVIWTGMLCASSTVEFRVMEGAGGSNLSVDFIETTVTPNAGSDVTICAGNSTQLNGSASTPSSNSPITLNFNPTFIGDEARWVIEDMNGLILASGGPYNTTGNQVYTNTFNVPIRLRIRTDGTYNDNTATWSLFCNGSSIGSGSINGGQNTVVQSNVSCNSSISLSYSYSWSPGTGLSAANVANPTATPSATTTYTLSASNSGCSVTDDVLVTVNTLSTAPSISGTSTICIGSSTTLTASGGTNGTGATINWYSGPNGTGTLLGTGNSITVSPVSATTIYARREGTCNISTDGSIAITVNPTSVAGSVSSNQSICSGSSPANITLTSNTGNIQWQVSSDNSSFSNVVGATASPLTSAQMGALTATRYYRAMVTSGVCASVYSSSVTVNVSSVPTVSNAGPDQTGLSTCGLTQVTLAGNTPTVGTGAWSIQSGTGGTVTTASSATSTFSGTAGSTYTLRWTISNSPCTASTDDVIVTFNRNPTASNAGADQTGSATCGLTQVTLAGNTPTVGTGAWSIQSGTGGTVTTASSATSTFSGTAGSTYTLRWTISNNPCTASTDDVIVAFGALPTAANAGSDQSGANTCGRSTVTLAGNAPTGLESGVWDVISASGQAPGTGVVNSVSEYNSLFTGVPGATYTLRWTLTKGACTAYDDVSITLTQPTTPDYTPSNGDLLWGGLTDNGWSTSSNWYQYNASQVVNNVQTSAWERLTTGEPSGTSKVMIMQGDGTCRHSTNMPSLSLSETVNNLTVSTGATLNLSNGSMSVKGDVINYGTINPGTGTLSFDATSGNQTIGGTQAILLNNLTLDKQAGDLNITTPIIVKGTLNMARGNINNSAILTVGENSSTTGSIQHANGTILGQLRRYFDADATPGSGYYFPVGNTSNTRGATIDFTSSPGSNQYLTVQYVSGYAGGATPLYTGLPLTTADGVLIQNFDNEGYWEINPTADNYNSSINSAPYSISLQMKNLTGVNDRSTVRIIKAAGSSTPAQHHNTWSALTFGATPVTGTSNTDFSVTGTSTGFSWFGAGSGNNNPLPVELLSFTGLCDEGIINLTWQTASEFNSSHFDVEKSRDGENWQLLTTLPSAGTSNELITYQSTDQNGTEGNNYFRLRQVDIDGTEKLYDPINVSCSEVTTGYFSSFPNPSGTSFQVVVNNKELIGACTLNMVDASGKVIEQRTIDVKEGINLFVINQELNPGIYFLNITNGAKSTQILRHAVK